MSHSKYIDLDRTFYQLPKSTQADELETEFESTIPLFERGINWKELLKEPRAIILSEAGSGKSSEILHTTRMLRSQNLTAFFIRIEDLVDGVDGFEVGTADEFNNWLTGSESAWIFLDSVDEAKLADARDFNKAIRRFGNRIEEALDRSFIFITSRASSWSYKSDLDFCNRFLPFTRAEEFDFSKECFKVYSLTDLDLDQIEKFLEANNVPEVERFLAETSNQETRMFTNRPQDLLELIGYWKRYGSIGSKYQLIQDSIDWRLTEIDETRAQTNPISKERLLAGVEKVAVAMILMKKFTARISDGTNESVGFELKNVLSDWDNRDCTTLLSRPIFDDAIYGSVRFHHRSVREYLAARWFFKKLNDGSPRSPIEALFFKSHYGVSVIIPSMRHILPWLAQMDEKVRQRVIEIDPHALLEGGDPAMFPCHIREYLLEKICQCVHDKKSNWHFNNWESVKKMAKSDVANKISQLLRKYSDDSTILSLLLDSALFGGVKQCLPEASLIAINTNLDTHARTSAIGIIREFDDQRMENIRHFYSTNNLPLDRSLAKELITGYVVDKNGIDWLIQILALIYDVDKYHTSGLTTQLIEMIKKLDLYLSTEIGKRIGQLLSQEPFIENEFCEVSKKNAWLFDVELAIIEDLLRHRDHLIFQSEFVYIIEKIQPIRHYHVSSNKNNVIKMISEWDDFKYYLYWQYIERERIRLNQQAIRLKYYYQVLFFDNELGFHLSDIPHLFKKINCSNNDDNQLVALTLCLKIYRDSNRPRNLLNSIKKIIGNNSDMLQILHNFLHPPKLSKADRRFLARNRAYKSRREIRDKKQALIWNQIVNKVRDNPDQLRNNGLEPGKISDFQYYMFERSSSKADNEIKSWINTEWRLLEPIIGEDAALAYRDGVMSFWRHYIPSWSNKTGKIELNKFLFFALSGLHIEAMETENWPEKLSGDEIILSCKYAFASLNAFPSWFIDLLKRNTEIVTALIFQEIERETSMKGDDAAMISRIFYHQKDIWKILGAGLMARLREDRLNMHDVGYAVRIVESLDHISDTDITELVSYKCRNSTNSENLPIWYASWIGVNPDPAIEALREYLGSFEFIKDAEIFAMKMISSLLGTRGRGGYTRQNFKNPKSLKELILLTYSYIRREDDLERAGTGVYSPGLRDDAQDARNRLDSFLRDIPGKESFMVLMDLAQNHPHLPYRKWMMRHAVDRATIDSVFAPYSESDFEEFCNTLERTPSNHKELYELAVLRLLDLKADLEDGDNSFAYNLVIEQREVKVRNTLGGWCREKSNNRYSIVQEEELADAKKPDLRFLGNTFDGPVPVEIKLANKWTADTLAERLENQLCGDYLRDKRSNYGIFLLVNQSKKTWTVDGRVLDFAQLVHMLELHWSKISKDYPGINDVKVIGIDLVRRSA